MSGLLFLAGHGLLTAVASPVAECGVSGAQTPVVEARGLGLLVIFVQLLTLRPPGMGDKLQSPGSSTLLTTLMIWPILRVVASAVHTELQGNSVSAHGLSN